MASKKKTIHRFGTANEEQMKIDSMRDPKDKTVQNDETVENGDGSENQDTTEDEEIGFPDFIANLK